MLGWYLSLFSINLYDITETFGIVFTPRMFLTSVWLSFFKTEDSVFINLSNPNWPLEAAERFEECTKYNLKINHKKHKVMVFSSRKCKSSWYAEGVKFNVVKYFMCLCIIFHINLSCKKQKNIENLGNNRLRKFRRKWIDAHFYHIPT